MQSVVYFIMGVSGCGKSTIGSELAKKLEIEFLDGDDFHPITNINKMTSGVPLTDDDRIPWLKNINKKCKEALINNESLVFACSALKKMYRNILENEIEKNVVWIFLDGNKQVISERVKLRNNHFMPLSLLDSQFEILEPPKKAIKINISSSIESSIEEIMNNIEKKPFGIVGLGVMGKSLARNLARNGVHLALYNRHVKDFEENVANKAIIEYSELSTAKGFEDIEQFVNQLEKPRKIFLMIKAGQETDNFIDLITPFLEEEDILIDGGNSHYLDTLKRIEKLKQKNISFIGTGVSGGEKGALTGPAIMPSGSMKGYKIVQPYFEKIAAKDINGNPCCSYIGPDGAGHYVKMVHNGIEYAEMQLLAETYAYLRYSSNKNPLEISTLFKEWNQGELASYLLEITTKILLKKEGDDWLIDTILDEAGNKGTGNWTTISASELGMPNTVITSALFARYLSVIKNSYDKILVEKQVFKTTNELDLTEIKNAYKLARIINHQQGFMLLKAASDNYHWNINLSEVARIWTNGCIIRSNFMNSLVQSLIKNNDLFCDEQIIHSVLNDKAALKNFCISSLQHNLPIPCFLSSLDYINTLNNNYSTANIIQAQRDFFGAHTYKKRNDPSNKHYHTVWE